MFFRLNSGGTSAVNWGEPGTTGEARTVSGSLGPLGPLDKHPSQILYRDLLALPSHPDLGSHSVVGKQR